MHHPQKVQGLGAVSAGTAPPPSLGRDAFSLGALQLLLACGVAAAVPKQGLVLWSELGLGQARLRVVLPDEHHQTWVLVPGWWQQVRVAPAKRANPGWTRWRAGPYRTQRIASMGSIWFVLHAKHVCKQTVSSGWLCSPHRRGLTGRRWRLSALQPASACPSASGIKAHGAPRAPRDARSSQPVWLRPARPGGRRERRAGC